MTIDINYNKCKVEALLFAAGRYVDEEELMKHAEIDSPDSVKELLNLLKEDYSQRKCPMHITNLGNAWKINVTEHFLPLVQGIVNLPEFDKPLMETLAVISWKYPALQCDIIKIRHNKAYEHLKILEEQGFIVRSKYGRTRKITLSKKFFEYFDLPTHKQAQEAFRDSLPDEVKSQVEETERQIEESEKVIEEDKERKEKEKAESEEGKNSNQDNANKEEIEKEIQSASSEDMKDWKAESTDDPDVELVDEKTGKAVELEEYETPEKEEDKLEVYEDIDETEVSEISDAQTFDELYDALDALGTLHGSKRDYPADELKDIIKQIQQWKLTVDYITRAGGLRDKVKQLMENEPKPEGQEPKEEKDIASGKDTEEKQEPEDTEEPEGTDEEKLEPEVEEEIDKLLHPPKEEFKEEKPKKQEEEPKEESEDEPAEETEEAPEEESEEKESGEEQESKDSEEPKDLIEAIADEEEKKTKKK